MRAIRDGKSGRLLKRFLRVVYMRIIGIKTYVLQGLIEDKAFGWSQRVTDRRQAVICVVSTDEDIQGVGEAFYFGKICHARRLSGYSG